MPHLLPTFPLFIASYVVLLLIAPFVVPLFTAPFVVLLHIVLLVLVLPELVGLFERAEVVGLAVAAFYLADLSDIAGASLVVVLGDEPDVRLGLGPQLLNLNVEHGVPVNAAGLCVHLVGYLLLAYLVLNLLLVPLCRLGLPFDRLGLPFAGLSFHHRQLPF
jgi:hypothetical protein